MAYSFTRRTVQLVLPLAGVVLLGAAATTFAQSRTAQANAADSSAVANGTANGTAAIQNIEKSRAAAARATGTTALSRKATTATGAAKVSAAPAALALEDAGPGPASTPEPLSVILVGGALAGLYRMRRHIS
jgi:hypothetical protein